MGAFGLVLEGPLSRLVVYHCNVFASSRFVSLVLELRLEAIFLLELYFVSFRLSSNHQLCLLSPT